MDTRKTLLATAVLACLTTGAALAQSSPADPASPPLSGTQQNIGNSQGNASQTGAQATEDAGGSRSRHSHPAGDTSPDGRTGDFNISPSSNLQGPVGEGEATQWWPGKDSDSNASTQER
ncbi:hypothetical protein [Eleftheria terrae]|uniref:hypothetical protein n=1 Tax=Eleftheria terrae TaxID=1597781 RepID=UPI00263AD9CD|nr:hypothetical protein [Eleftheria terrae]WKB52451.1 hypothetical protein N7L95_22070 [Eleftheria terrae]